MRQRPDITGIENIDASRTVHSKTHYSIGKNSLYKNKYGIWELYVEGDALERGVIGGSLTRELMHKQETAFMNKIYELVPGNTNRNFLKKTVAWFNRKMYLHVPEEYQKEIYGTSLFGLEKYDDFAPAYIRMLYFHGAHDIGHALQDFMLVGVPLLLPGMKKPKMENYWWGEILIFMLEMNLLKRKSRLL